MEETLKNLHKAFIGESQARNRYTMYAKQAKKDGYEQLSEIFLETAEHEREHAKQLSKMINQLTEKMGKKQGEVLVEAGGNAVFGSTKENLEGSIAGEHHENSEMYPEFSIKAKEEGLEEIANKLTAIGLAEKHHEERYLRILEEIKNDTLFKKDEAKEWVCLKCGYIHTGRSPPEKCPSCSHETKYFIIRCEEY